MRTLITIRKRGAGYVMDLAGKFGGGYQGRQCGLTPYDAATCAAREMATYAAPAANPEGGDLMAPPEVMQLVPGQPKNRTPAPVDIRAKRRTLPKLPPPRSSTSGERRGPPGSRDATGCQPQLGSCFASKPDAQNRGNRCDDAGSRS